MESEPGNCDVTDDVHLGHFAGRDENRYVRKQVSLGADERLAEFRIASLLLQCVAQRSTVKRDAEAILVEPIRENLY